MTIDCFEKDEKFEKKDEKLKEKDIFVKMRDTAQDMRYLFLTVIKDFP